MQQLLGSNVQLGSYWLDIKYPDSPPPEYSRQGIEIADDYVAWAEQTIPHEHYVKLRHLMYPTAMFAAVQNSVKIFGHLQWIKVKNGLGIQLSQTDKQVSAISKIEKGRMQIESMQAKLESQDEAGSAERQRLLDRLNKSESGNAADQKPPALPKPKETDPPSSAISHPLLSFFLPTGAGSQSDDSESGSARRTLTPFKPNSDMMLAWKMFIQTLQITWRKSRLDMQPKGAFFVVGQVEVRGDRGRIRCDLHAAYNPKESKVVFCICQVKHFWEWRQRARGGP